MHQRLLAPWPRSQAIKEDRLLSEEHDSLPNLLELITPTTSSSIIYLVVTMQISLFSHILSRKRCTTATCTPLKVYPTQAACQANFLSTLTLWVVSTLSHLSSSLAKRIPVMRPSTVLRSTSALHMSRELPLTCTARACQTRQAICLMLLERLATGCDSRSRHPWARTN